MPLLQHVLVANRGEIARRILRTCRSLGLTTTAVCSSADTRAIFAREADHAVVLGPPPAAESYLVGSAILDAARQTGADAIHPGYGFLSENADFAQAVLDAGLVWIGPPPSAMRALGNKAAAREAAGRLGIPTVPGYDGADASEEAFLSAAQRIGFPVLVKASSGGGGRGMRRVDRPEDLPEALASARREAISAFGSERLLLERYVERPRHVEIQVLADTHGNVVHLGERECSIQRRHQKIVEEAPSPAVDPDLRARLGDAAVRLARGAGYASAGTVEFLLDRDGSFYLLEMNARLQVEHPVTEEAMRVRGERIDLVALQILIAEGRPLPFQQDDVSVGGHAIEVRICAEDPNRDFLPAAGRLLRCDLPEGEGIRVEAGFETGSEVPPHYDSLLAKVIASGPDRQSANRRLERALRLAWVPGLVTNLPLLREIAANKAWKAGDLDTGFLARNGLPGVPPLNLEAGAKAACLVAWSTRRAGRPDHPAIPAGWRMEGAAFTPIAWRCGAQTIASGYREIALDRLEVSIGGVVSSLVCLGTRGDEWIVEAGGRICRWRIARGGSGSGPLGDGETLYVHLGDGEAFLQLEPRFRPPVAEVEPGTCASPTPGKVVAVRVSPGDAVARGQVLVVLEAMKMEHRVVAPEDGLVAQVRVRPGDTVAQGDVLVRISSPEPG